MDPYQFALEAGSYIDGAFYEEVTAWDRAHEHVMGDMTVPQAFRLALLQRRGGNLFLAKRDWRKSQVQP